MDNVLIVDNLLTEQQCDRLIQQYTPQMGEVLGAPWNFKFVDLPLDHYSYDAGSAILQQYVEKFPAISLTKDKWRLHGFKFKEFPPGKYYDYWHSEVSCENPYRIACILIYLSDHNCGTEFYNGEVVYSKKGRGVVFPTYWTHTHRGQPCPDNKPRYIMNAYVNLFQE